MTRTKPEDEMAPIKPVTATDVIEPAIACDPLLSNVQLPLRRIYYPLGFAIEVITNSDDVSQRCRRELGWAPEYFLGTGA